MKKNLFFRRAFTKLLIRPLVLTVLSLFIFININAQCPDWNDCVSLLSSDGCTHTFVVSVEGDAVFIDDNPIFEVSINWNFSINGSGDIVTAGFMDINGEMSSKGVDLNIFNGSLNISYVDPNNPLNASLITGDQVFFIVESEPQSCFTISRSGINSIFNFNGVGGCMTTGNCDPIEVCTEGEYISGLVTAFSSDLADCPDTENLGIEGAEVTISSDNGSCTAQSKNDGSYGCYLCEGEEYEICVETVCEEPCGVSNLDLVLNYKWIKDVIQGNILNEDPIRTLLTDINNNGVSTFDLVCIQRYLLGLDVSACIDSWCRFVPVSDIESLLNEEIETTDIDECFTISDPNENVDFVRFMIGDFNGSCTDCIHDDEKGDLEIIFERNLSNGKGELKVSHEDDIYAFTLQMSIPPGTKVSSVDSPIPGLKYNINSDILHISWIDESSDYSGFELNKNISLVNIEYSGDSPSIINEGNYLLSNELEISNLVNRTRTRSGDSRTLGISNGNSIDIWGTNNIVTVDLFDLHGRIIERQVINVDHSQQVTFDRFIGLGIYFVRIYNDTNDTTQKIFFNNN